MKATASERAKIRLLYQQGYSDKEIAAQIGRSHWMIFEHRREMRLPGLPQDCRARVAHWHEKGLLDREIAEKLSLGRKNISVKHVGAIRRSMGRAPHKRHLSGAKRSKLGLSSRYRCRQLKTDAQIARLYGGMSYA